MGRRGGRRQLVEEGTKLAIYIDGTSKANLEHVPQQQAALEEPARVEVQTMILEMLLFDRRLIPQDCAA